jgi:hypothetical protein
VTVDYRFWPITVLDSFPDDEVFEATDLPMISIEIIEQTDKPYAIGQLSSFWSFFYMIDIFASNDGMRYDLMDRLQKVLASKWIPILSFSEHPLSYDGTINTQFDWDDQFILWMNDKGATRGSLLNDGEYTEKEKFRAVVRGSLTTVNYL